MYEFVRILSVREKIRFSVLTYSIGDRDVSLPHGTLFASHTSITFLLLLALQTHGYIYTYIYIPSHAR